MKSRAVKNLAYLLVFVSVFGTSASISRAQSNSVQGGASGAQGVFRAKETGNTRATLTILSSDLQAPSIEIVLKGKARKVTL